MSFNFRFLPAPYDPGYMGVPAVLKNISYTFAPDDNGKQFVHDSTAAHEFKFDCNVVYPLGFTVTITNDASAGVVTISFSGGLTGILAGAGTTGNRSLAANGICTVTQYKDRKFMSNGTGLT